MPGDDVVDEGLTDLASGRTSAASLLVSLAAPRLRREGLPVARTEADPERWWGWSPSVRLLRFADDPLGNLVQFGIPALILGMYLSGITMRMTRTMMLEILRQDYIRTA